MDIPPKGSVVMVFYLEVHESGPFEFEVPIYVDDDGFRELPVTVKGEAVLSSPAGH